MNPAINELKEQIFRTSLMVTEAILDYRTMLSPSPVSYSRGRAGSPVVNS